MVIFANQKSLILLPYAEGVSFLITICLEKENDFFCANICIYHKKVVPLQSK